MNYAIYNAQGEILRTIGCIPEDIAANVGDGEFLYEGDATVWDSIDPITAELVPGVRPVPPPPPPPPQEYVLQRQRAYPTVEKQLDMFWHAMDDGEFAKLEPWYSQIKAVKAAIPKVIDTSSDSVPDTEEL